MGTSFISEHTAELILVPQLTQLLARKYPSVTPLYHWISREGGIMSRASFRNKPIKVLAMYPRRPKVDAVGKEYIEVKFNQLLFDRAAFLISRNIPVIAGVSLANSLELIQYNTPPVWFEITKDGNEEICLINMASPVVPASSGIRMINADEILELVETMAEISTWQDTLDKINEMRRFDVLGHGRWVGMSGDMYKPIYFLIHVD